MDLVSDVAAIRDPIELAKAAGARIEELHDAVDQLAELRRNALHTLVDAGMTRAELARELSLTRARIGAMLTQGTPAARAFFGTRDQLIVAVGGKLETGRRDRHRQPVVSAEALAAYEVLADLARTLRLDPAYEVVPPPGIVDLNRTGLVVLTSPKLLPIIEQVLAADPFYGFGHDNNGWHLIDKTTGTVHRSPRDHGGQGDYAYLGRLPRIDGHGTFLYAAGIHAPGTSGAIRYLVDNLADLWREHRNRRFSMLLDVRTDRTALLAPARRHKEGT